MNCFKSSEIPAEIPTMIHFKISSKVPSGISPGVPSEIVPRIIFGSYCRACTKKKLEEILKEFLKKNSLEALL